MGFRRVSAGFRRVKGFGGVSTGFRRGFGYIRVGFLLI